MAAAPSKRSPTVIGHYVVGGVLAQGGMAVVHIARAKGAHGFERLVALKRILPHFSGDPDFASMFVDEARLAARVRHPNVVPTFDVVVDGNDLCIVMEYVHGVTLSQLLKLVKARGERVPPAIACAIVRDTLEGLHAAHEAVDDKGQPLGIVHRDVSPQNILLGTDGVARVLDFGIAKANVRLHETRTGQSLKGKLAYMAPEQLEARPVVRSADVFSASVVLWEALAGERLYGDATEAQIVLKVVNGTARPPSAAFPALGAAYDEVVLRGLARDPGQRFGTAREMSLALTAAAEIAAAPEVAEWLQSVAAEPLAERAASVRALEASLRASLHDELAPDPESTRSAVEVRASPLPASRSRRRGIAVTVAVVGVLGVVAAGARWRASPTQAAQAPPATASVAPVAILPSPAAPALPAPDTVEPSPAPTASTAPTPAASAAKLRPRGAPSGHAPHPAAAVLPDHL